MPPYRTVDRMGMARRLARDPRDPWSDVERGGEFAERSVIGYGERLRPDILRDIGTTIGDINAAGGLRSGAVSAHLGDISEKYGAMVGAYGKEATLAGGSLGARVREQRFAEDEARRRRKRGIFKALGGVLGAGVGALAGGIGAAAGAKIGSKL